MTFTNFKKRRTEELVVSLVSPSGFNWKNSIIVNENSEEWEVLLPPFNQGFAEYAITAKNEQG